MDDMSLTPSPSTGATVIAATGQVATGCYRTQVPSCGQDAGASVVTFMPGSGLGAVAGGGEGGGGLQCASLPQRSVQRRGRTPPGQGEACDS